MHDLVVTIVSLLVLAMLVHFLMPSQAGSTCSPSLHDKTRIKQIHAAMLIFADNHVESIVTFFPSRIRFRFEGDEYDRPDNIYAAEFAHRDGPEAAPDAWLSVSIGSTEFTVDDVFDPLRRR